MACKEINCSSLKDILLNISLPKNKKEKDKLLTSAVIELINSIKQKEYAKSFGLARFIFFTGFDNPIDTIKKLGAFRSSKYNYNYKLLREVLDVVQFQYEKADKNETYFNSVRALLLVSPDILHLENKIKTIIKSRPHFLKTMLALAEIKFVDLIDKPEQNSFHQEGFYLNKEDIISSVSQILLIYLNAIKEPAKNTFIYIDENIQENVYTALFLDAYKIQCFNACEIELDFFGHIAYYSEPDKTIILENDKFDIAKSYGYTKTLLRHASLANQIDYSVESPTFEDFLNTYWQKDRELEHSSFYELVKEPIERIVVRTLFLAHDDPANIFSTKILFKDEIIAMEILCQENYNPSLLEKNIYKEFKIFDIIKIQRLFKFISFIFRKAYIAEKEKSKKDIEIIRKRSVLPVIQYDIAASMLNSICNVPLEQCKELIDRLSIDLSSGNNLEWIDLQYTPILKLHERCLFLPTVFSASNIVRSLSLSEKIHLSAFENNDNMINAVCESLKSKGFNIYNEITFGDVEIDIGAYRDGELFLFECKNPYHPVNDFELRNTFSHLEKGFFQIQKIKSKLEDLHNLKNFTAKLGGHNVKDIHYGIINANRALTGLEYDGVRVFHANELINFLNTGEILSNAQYYNCWKDKTFDTTDLIDFINGKVITCDFIDCIEKNVDYIKLRTHMMGFNHYGLRLDELDKLNAKKYRLK